MAANNPTNAKNGSSASAPAPKSSGKMHDGAQGVKLGTTYHSPGKGTEVAHPIAGGGKAHKSINPKPVMGN